MKKLKITVDGKTYNVEVEILDGSQASGAAIPQPQSVPVVTSAAVSAPAPSAPAPSRPASGPASDGDVLSPLSGKVVAVNASVGQALSEGDQILTLEAMKMNTFIYAPAAGTLTRIDVAVGDAVEEGQILAHIG